MQTISSKANPRFRYWRELLKGSELKQSSHFLVTGRKLVPDFLERHEEAVDSVLLSEELDTEQLITPTSAAHYLLAKDLFQQLDKFGTYFPILVVKQPKISHWDSSLPPEGLEVFSSLGDPANLGAFLRCCEGFKVKKIIILKESAHPFHPKSVRASVGSCFRVPLFWGPTIHQELGDEIIILDQKGNNLSHFKWPLSTRLLFGEEGQGLPPLKRNKQTSLCIPISPDLESLNAVSAASIALFHYRLQYPL